MRGWTRGGAVALIGALVGLATGFLIWGREAASAGLQREYIDGARARVARVVDGDTVVLEDGLHVRYRGCDTPETYRFTRDPQPMAERAAARNRELVEGAWVRLRFPPAGMPAIDAHGRILADVRADGERWAESPTVAETLVREGLARASSFELDRAARERMRQAESAAREAQRGLWAPAPSAPGQRFVASRRGRMVHRQDCIYAEKISPRNLMFYDDLKAALDAGRRKCPTCFEGTRSRARASRGAREAARPGARRGAAPH